MKKYALRTIVILMCLSIGSLSLSAQGKKKQDASKFVGEWTFSTPDSPEGYQDGTASLKLDKGKLTGEFTVGGFSSKVDVFKETENGFSSTLYVEGYPVTVTLTWKNDRLEGTADTGDAIVSITFKKAAKQGKTD
jgi:hypothetical protein